MDYYERLNNQTGENWVQKMNEEYPCRPLLPALDADAEISRLHGIIKAQAGTIAELQETIRQISQKEVWEVFYTPAGQKELRRKV